jgi:hypothetical protein
VQSVSWWRDLSRVPGQVAVDLIRWGVSGARCGACAHLVCRLIDTLLIATSDLLSEAIDNRPFRRVPSLVNLVMTRSIPFNFGAEPHLNLTGMRWVRSRSVCACSITASGP